jgi:hypothetical protein
MANVTDAEGQKPGLARHPPRWPLRTVVCEGRPERLHELHFIVIST